MEVNRYELNATIDGFLAGLESAVTNGKCVTVDRAVETFVIIYHETLLRKVEN
jgi:hypothetical protein